MRIVLEKLNSSTLIRLLKHVVWRLGEENRYCNVDVTGHSLGAAAGLLVCRRLALDGCVVEGHFFNPPLITLDSLARTFAPWEVYDAGRRIGKKVLPAEDRTERRKTAKEEFYRLENWSPYLYVNKYDLLGCKFVSNLKKPIHETVDGDQSWYKRLYPYSNEFTQMLVGKTESYHLFPSAHLVTIKAYSRLRPYSAHRLSNWIHPNLKYDFKHVKADDIQKFSSQCSMSPEEGPNMEPEEIGTDDEGPSEVSAEDECSSDGSAEDECPSDGSAEDPMGKGEEQGGDTEVEISSQGLRPPRQPPMYTPSGKVYSELPAELTDTVVDLNSMEELRDQIVKDVGKTIAKQQPMPSGQVSSGVVDLDCGEGHLAKEPKSAGLSAAYMFEERVIPLLRYLDKKMLKYDTPIAGSYVELVRSRTRAKVAASVEIAKRVPRLTIECATVKPTLQEQEERLRQSELECAELRKSLAAEKHLHSKAELESMDLRIDFSTAQKVTVELRDKVEVLRRGIERELERAEYLTATLATRDQLHAAKLAAKAKELADSEAARYSELEQRKRLEADCNELRSRLSAVEEQLIIAQEQLLETKPRFKN
ncbi:hypothetical protein AXG93_2643s1010 [Marchantia polymorpha subsp. ruderalis]|uniref:Fungal lipase-like domain-containing protein n=1 Tax=Marchantia polymorpha subsp. ruderalis TaxID=1480154 RepID=A0A176W2C7_MARPO|nr:hypothetical protein AXG93_2643s1010 [Marchantia polymorpha subsp. ruderalis]